MMKMINKAKEGLENTLCRNDAIRDEERARMAQNNVIVLSGYLSSDDSLETSSVDDLVQKEGKYQPNQ